jgi:citronellyl-CoA synthetase
MSDTLHPQSRYVITQEKYERHMAYTDSNRIVTDEEFVGKLIALITKGNTEGGISWGMLLEENAEKYPSRMAIKWDDDDLLCHDEPVITQNIRYKELNELVNQYAHYFMSQGLRTGDVVCILLDNRVELCAVNLAVAKVGAVSCFMNTNWPPQTMTHGFNLNPGKMLIVGEEHVDKFQQIESAINPVQGQQFFYMQDKGEITPPRDFIDFKEAVKAFPLNNPETTAKVEFNSPCFLIFTSGTSGGMPKAALRVHAAVMSGAYAFSELLDLQPNDTVYVPLPFYHNHALGVSWASAMYRGSAIAMRRKFSASRFWNDTRKFHATKFGYIGEMCQYLLNQPEKPDDTANPVEAIVGNGLRPEIWKAFKKRFDIPFVLEFYGATEARNMFVNAYNFDCTVGYSPLPNEIVKYDPETETPVRGKGGFLERVEVGEEGLCLFEISELSPFDGYTNKEETEKKVLRDVFKAGDAWFNTGDLLRDIGFGQRQFVDRLGDTFRWRGENVSTTEVEAIASEFHQVYLSAAYGVRIPGTDGRAGMVTVSPLGIQPEEFDLSGFSEALRNNLADFAVPKFLRISLELPTTGTMKVIKGPLKREGFDITRTSDPLYVLLPGESEFTTLTEEIYKNIGEGVYRF